MMKGGARSGRHPGGFSLIEVLVGAMILGMTLMSLAAAGGMAMRHTQLSRNDMDLWAALHRQVEQLLATDHGSLTDGSAVVQGYPMSWTVSGSDPKEVILVTERTNLGGEAVEDTVILYRAAPRTVDSELDDVGGTGEDDDDGDDD